MKCKIVYYLPVGKKILMAHRIPLGKWREHTLKRGDLPEDKWSVEIAGDKLSKIVEIKHIFLQKKLSKTEISY